ncbi:MAG: hypothetical protein A2X77_05205 [Gammaproteobacteria bacterium GWE2_42_36]|nr:MAG: hypothetical protein A2X77_05205 [Gammaproteobacteria bacterium GWE2_42_36]HCU05868.1 hypothetical protein [Coxiellaceae bacterium]
MKDDAKKRFETTKSMAVCRLQGRIRKLLSYFEGRQKRYPKCKEIQASDYPAKQMLEILKAAFNSFYNHSSPCSGFMLNDYLAVRSMQNELAGLFQVDQRALKVMDIPPPAIEIESRELRSFVIKETRSYLSVNGDITPFLTEADFAFLSDSSTELPRLAS